MSTAQTQSARRSLPVPRPSAVGCPPWHRQACAVVFVDRPPSRLRNDEPTCPSHANPVHGGIVNRRSDNLLVGVQVTHPTNGYAAESSLTCRELIEPSRP